jgi:hypothetical protein
VGWTGGLGCQLEMDTQLSAGMLSLSIQAGFCYPFADSRSPAQAGRSPAQAGRSPAQI